MQTVLLVEPHGCLRQSLRDWLRAQLSMCAIVTAADVAQAIALAADQLPSVMLLDLDTIAAAELQALLRLSQFSHCRVIGLGLDDTPAHRQRARLAGVACFVAKDQLQTSLLPHIQALLQAGPKSESAYPAPVP